MCEKLKSPHMSPPLWSFWESSQSKHSTLSPKVPLKHKTQWFHLCENLSFFHNCKRLQQKCFDPPADWISAANWGTLLGDVSSSLLKGEQPIRLWWRIRLFFPVQKIQKTHPNCIWMQRAASPRSQREKNHQVFFFYFHFAFGFFFFFFFFEKLQSGVSYLLSGCLTSKM